MYIDYVDIAERSSRFSARICRALTFALARLSCWHWQHVTLYFVTCSWSAVCLHCVNLVCW